MGVQLNGITFSNINTTDNIAGYTAKRTKSSLISNNKYSETKLSNMINAVNNGNTTWDKVAFINGVDIDWNGAEITSTAFPAMDRTINTTGDLLSWIKNGIEEAAKTGGSTEPVKKTRYWYIGSTKQKVINTTQDVPSGLGWRKYQGTDGIVYDGEKINFKDYIGYGSGFYYLVIPKDAKVLLPNGENYLLAFNEVGFENNQSITFNGIEYKQYISKYRIASFSGIIKI